MLRTPHDYSSSRTGLTYWVDLLEGVSTEDILASLVDAHKFLPSSMYWEMAFKIVHRAYVSPNRSFLMGQSTSHNCLKCNSPHADLLHNLWSCPHIRRFWQYIKQFTLDFLLPTCPDSMTWALFGILPSDLSDIPKAHKRLLFYISAAARKSVLQCWIEPTPPTKRVFLEKLSFLFRMDWVETALNKEKKTKLFFSTWDRFIHILPSHIKTKLQNCFGFTTWYLEQQVSGHSPIQT